MEITNEIKAKVFAQYLGQRCNHKVFMVWKEWEDRGESIMDSNLIRIYEDVELHGYDTKLLLRHISAITDEDAIECYKIVDPRGNVEGCEYWTHRHKPKAADNPDRKIISIDVRRIDVPNECFNLGFESASFIYYNDRETSERDFQLLERIEKQIQVYQFLQSRGYDLPNYLLGGKTLHEAGLAIYPKDI